jgi:hypothetical protein
MKRVVTGAVIAVLMTAGSACAADTALGTVKTVDVFARTVVLEDGASYPVLRGINLAKFKAGDKVVLETEDRKGTRTIVKLSKGERVPILIPGGSRTRVP